MAKEIHLFGKKKDAYPTKTTINFYIKEDKNTGVSTILLYTVFVIVLLFALTKWLVLDLVADLNKEMAAYETNLATLESYQEKLSEYDTINTEYNRYSYSYLTETDKVQDRMDVLKIMAKAAATAKTFSDFEKEISNL